MGPAIPIASSRTLRLLVIIAISRPMEFAQSLRRLSAAADRIDGMRTITVSRKLSFATYEDGLEAFRNDKHPCHPFVIWQKERGRLAFQLPEPFSGRRSTLGMVVVGFNPAFTSGEVMPTASPMTSFDEYDRFYRERFDASHRDSRGQLRIAFSNGQTIWAKNRNNIERFGTEHLFRGEQRFFLGKHALLIDVVRYKSSECWTGAAHESSTIMQHEREHTRKLLENLKPLVVVPSGGDALMELQAILRFRQVPPPKIMRAVGRSFEAELPSGASIAVCPTAHFSHDYHMTPDCKRQIATRIAEALGI